MDKLKRYTAKSYIDGQFINDFTYCKPEDVAELEQRYRETKEKTHMSKQRKSYLYIAAGCFIISLVFLSLMGFAHKEPYRFRMSCEGVTVGALVDARAEGEDPRNLRAVLAERIDGKRIIGHIYPERKVGGKWIPIGAGTGWWIKNINQRDRYTIIKTLSYHEAIFRWLLFKPRD